MHESYGLFLCYFYRAFLTDPITFIILKREAIREKIAFIFGCSIPLRTIHVMFSLFFCSVLLTCSPPGTAGTHHILGSWNNIATLTLGTRTLLAGVGLLAVYIITFRTHLQIWYLISRVTASCKHNKSNFLSSGFFFITETQIRTKH